ncbi:signal transduction histidine kinase [Catalinimonas alkaloidigena]|uniref:sensor histidine kinase n=1 Tax=Catalinimonas alkaloidigena TaxID=1075417 RepID=UPI0024068F8F|nr:sensor histidine kinase [Catalinimonas alkaloidigena]MDF9798271.1 signal transduction histidine kinase [Catalinimonas alkaloidigena]
MNIYLQAYYKFLSLIVFKLILILLMGCQANMHQVPTAQQGILDLRQWDFEKYGSVKLNGEWTFYWQELLSSDPSLLAVVDKPDYISLPSDWKNYELNGQTLGGQGYASYALDILLPENHTELGINILSAATAMSLYADDSLIYVAGKVGKDAQSAQPWYAPDFVRFFPQGDTLKLQLEVSNFHYRRGGAWSPFFLGSFTDIRKTWILESGLEFFLAGCILIMALYYLGFYFFRRDDSTYLIFSIACFFIVIRILSTGKYLIHYLLPLNWNWMVRLELLGFYLFVPLFLSFLFQIYPKLILKQFIQFVWVTSIAFSLWVMLSPPLSFSYSIIPYEIFTIVICIFVLYRIIKKYDKNAPGQTILLISLIAFFLAFINDVLYANNLISTGYITSLGLLLFILSQSLILSQRVSLALHGLENANQTLSVQNETIHSKNKELTRLNKELDVFVYRTSHDLRAPLTSTMGLIEVLRMEDDPNKFEAYLNMQEQALNRLDDFIQDILNYSRNTRLEVVHEPVDFKLLLEEVFVLYQHLSNYQEVEKNTEIKQEGIFYGDKKRLSIIMNNLVSNAFRYYDPEKTKPYLRINVFTDSQKAEIVVEDNGLGIDQKHHKKIFDMFYRASNSAKGSGLGLFLVKESVTKMNGEIHLKSDKGAGCTFLVVVPNQSPSDEQ